MDELAPERDIIARQQAELPGQEQAAVAGLEQARTNAFSDITTAANERGMVYSGAPIAEQQRYVGERFLPALAGVRSDFTTRRYKLEDALLGVARSAQDIQAGEQKAEADAAYRQEQLAIQRLRAAKTGAARQPTATEVKTSARNDLNDDLSQAFQGFAARPQFYTEKTLIPQLIKAYPEFSAKEIASLVYQYRKLLGFG